jgi:glycine/D-amino acid oxidase-like deaminating enzyme
MGVTPADVLIVGAGMLGAASAYHHARAGRRVVLLEMATPASGATGNSFAWTNAVRKEPEPYHRLNAEGMAEYAVLSRELGVASGHHAGGSLEWAAPAERDELRERVARLAGRGYPAKFVPAQTARAMEPGLAVPDDVEVAFYESDGWVDAPRR